MAAPSNTEPEYALAELESSTEVSLLDLLALLFRRIRLIAACSFVAMAVTAGAVFLIPPTYTAETVILPPQPEASSQTLLMGALPGLSGFGGLAGAGGAASLWRNPGDIYAGILMSRTIADAIIARFQLKQRYQCRTLTQTRKALEQHTRIVNGKDLLIRIRVDDRSSSLAAQIANAYVDELHRQNSRLAITSASQRRLFFENQLSAEKNALAEAEVAMKNMQQASGLVYPPGQSEALIRAVAQLRAEIASREVQLQSMRLYATGNNPQFQVLQQEVTALGEQLAKLEAGSAAAGTFVSGRRLPDVNLEYVRKLRDLKYHEALFEILAKQYEAARMDEGRLSPLIQVVDAAVAPDAKSWPPRTLFILAAGALGALAAAAFVLTGNRRKVQGTAS